MRRYVGCLAIAVLLIGCSESSHEVPQAQKDQLSQIEWMIGEWAMLEEGRTLAEHWERASEVAFAGRGLAIKDNDTTVTERLEIRATDSGLFYIADVPQNPEPVWFGMTEGSDSLARFENPEYQLPNKITYAREGADLIRVRVDGFRGDEPTGFEWLLARVVSADSLAADSISSR